MAAASWDIELEKGSDFDTTILLEDENGAMSLNGYAFDLKIWDKPRGELRYTASTSNGKITVFGANIRIVIPDDEVDAFTWNRGYTEIAWEISGSRTKLLKGTVRVIE